MPKHFRTVTDFSISEIKRLFDLTRTVKKHPERVRSALEGQTLAMIFEKPSLRTRVTFQTGIFQMGGQGIYLGPTDIQLGKRETVEDISANLSRWVDCVMIRTFGQDRVERLTEASRIPIINGLSDRYHPCQALADFYTLLERKKTLQGCTLAWIGDGNNVLNSLMLLGAMMGMHVRYATPKGYEPQQNIVHDAKVLTTDTGGTIQGFHDPQQAVAKADAVYTDVWASMGQEKEASARKEIFAPYQVNQALMNHAKPDALFMHCLPAHRGDEVTDKVIDATSSVVFEQAENRLHAQKALMLTLMK